LVWYLASDRQPRPDSEVSVVPGSVLKNQTDGFTYVWVPQGKFIMGCSPDSFCLDSEKPPHEVILGKGFWMAQTPVTVAAYTRYVQAMGKDAPADHEGLGRKLNAAAGDDSLPVVGVTWDQAAGYCGWLGMRLPSEAEWEYAARAGTTSELYGKLDDIAWYADNSGRQPLDSDAIFEADQKAYQHVMNQKLLDNGNGPKPVAQKRPNAYGLYDMLGNVWQWTADWYDEKYYQVSEKRDPAGPKNGTLKVVRGGGWDYLRLGMRVSVRGADAPGVRDNDMGFRCVKE
jgi:formylglycine-generating enzyme required for sulfatase activity